MNNRIITIGSSADCDICIDNPNVAERHGIISVDGDMLCLELMPGCTAYLNDNEVEGKFWLQDNDIIVIGMKRLDVSRIHVMLEEGCDFASGQPYEDVESIDDLKDAVVVKHNWWPTIIITIVVLAIIAFMGNRIMKYQQVKKAKEEEIRIKQDSIRRSQFMIDSLNGRIKEFETE